MHKIVPKNLCQGLGSNNSPALPHFSRMALSQANCCFKLDNKTREHFHNIYFNKQFVLNLQCKMQISQFFLVNQYQQHKIYFNIFILICRISLDTIKCPYMKITTNFGLKIKTFIRPKTITNIIQFKTVIISQIVISN